MTANIDDVRRTALDRVDASRKRAVGFLIAGGVAEGVVFLCLMVLMDFGDPVQLVVFLSACLVYAPLAFGLFALKSYIDLSTQRVLTAVELDGS